MGGALRPFLSLPDAVRTEGMIFDRAAQKVLWLGLVPPRSGRKFFYIIVDIDRT
jgi:hypothetical protein